MSEIRSPSVVDRFPSLGLVSNSGTEAERRFLEFFAAHVRNRHTRIAYFKAATDFFDWCQQRGLSDLSNVEPLHVAAWIEGLQSRYSASTVKQRLAGVKRLFDWLVIGQVVRSNPASSVRGPRLVIRKGKTPVLDASEVRHLLDAIDTAKIVGLRDRALIGLMVYSFARVGAALSMRVEDVFIQNRRFWIRLHEKGGKRHEMPCHHNLETWLSEYMDVAGLWDDEKGWLFRTVDRKTKRLSIRQLAHANAYQMVLRRARQAGLSTKVGNHSFRATGVTVYLKNGGTLENAARMANHASTRTTQLYDRRSDEIQLDEIERILI